MDYLTNCTGPPPDTDLPTLPKGPASLPFQFFGPTGVAISVMALNDAISGSILAELDAYLVTSAVLPIDLSRA